MDEMLAAALQYHAEGLCVIPIKPRDKAPALQSWEEYQERCSTEAEVRDWFDNGKGYNVGIVHGAVSNGYAVIDVDHDAGLFEIIRARFPALFAGRLEQSGSGEGYHIPLRLDTLPDFGTNRRDDRPRGNRTWKTEHGHCNLRIQYCQTLVPPSWHPNGNRYRFIQEGPIVCLPDLRELIAWLNEQSPPPAPRALPERRHETQATEAGNLTDTVRVAWPTAMDIFKHFGIVGATQQERNGELRILGHGGLLIAEDDPATWYCFSDEIGGGVFEAWGWCRFGSAFDKRRHFRQVLLEMARAAGIDTARHYKSGDEQLTQAENGDRNYWGTKHAGRWGRMR